MSRTLSISNGSGDSLKHSVRCGCNPNARQIRLIVDRVSPLAVAAAEAPVGRAARRLFQRAHDHRICSSLIRRGVPGRGSSYNPSTPSRRCATCTPSLPTHAAVWPRSSSRAPPHRRGDPGAACPMRQRVKSMPFISVQRHEGWGTCCSPHLEQYAHASIFISLISESCGWRATAGRSCRRLRYSSLM